MVWKINWESFGIDRLAGVDEAGRGCLAGSVFAAAVILRPKYRLKNCTDSKLLPPEKRYQLAARIREDSLCWSIGIGTVEEIEKINILQASLLAMRRAVEGLCQKPEFLLVDGNQKIGGPWKQETLIKGDLRCLPISAASILAKTERDRHMEEMNEKYPGYEFAKHKGYSTPAHCRAIARLGPTVIHRKTFAGVKEFLEIRK